MSEVCISSSWPRLRFEPLRLLESLNSEAHPVGQEQDESEPIPDETQGARWHPVLDHLTFLCLMSTSSRTSGPLSFR